MEYLKNRQSTILGNLSNIKFTDTVTLPAVLSSDSTLKSLKTHKEQGKKKKTAIEKRISALLEKPGSNDKIYQVFDEIFQSPSDHVLTRDMNIRKKIKRLAWRRFMLGYPPRKGNDTSIGDPLNWEWIVHCAQSFPGKIVIVSRDGDYGSHLGKSYFLNDQLLKEFRDRVGKKSIKYTQSLSEALKDLDVHVSKQEEEAESQRIADSRTETLIALREKLRNYENHYPTSQISEILSRMEGDSGTILSTAIQRVVEKLRSQQGG